MKALLKSTVAGAVILAGIGTGNAALVAPPHENPKPIDWHQVFAAEQEQIAHLHWFPITCSDSLSY